MMTTIIAMLSPLMWLYSSFEHGNDIASGEIHKLSLGNLGFAGPQCKDTTVGSGKLLFGCPTGQISEVFDFGITPDGSILLDPCM